MLPVHIHPQGQTGLSECGNAPQIHNENKVPMIIIYMIPKI